MGPVIAFWAPEARGPGVPEVIESAALREGRISPPRPCSRPGCTGLTIATGGSVGREGPVVGHRRRYRLLHDPAIQLQCGQGPDLSGLRRGRGLRRHLQHPHLRGAVHHRSHPGGYGDGLFRPYRHCRHRGGVDFPPVFGRLSHLPRVLLYLPSQYRTIGLSGSWGCWRAWWPLPLPEASMPPTACFAGCPCRNGSNRPWGAWAWGSGGGFALCPGSGL